MIYVYTSAGCASCRRVISWLRDHNIPYVERTIKKNPTKDKNRISKEEIIQLLKMTESGTDDVVSRRSTAFGAIEHRYDSMSLMELVEFIYDNPTCMKRPILVRPQSSTRPQSIIIGYDSEELTVLLPRGRRNMTTW